MSIRTVAAGAWLLLAVPTPQPGSAEDWPPAATMQDLNGVWSGDGGTYYIRQIHNTVWWYGENSPTAPSFSNVAHGHYAGRVLRLDWADVPKGQTASAGKLVLKVDAPNHITAEKKTGGFGGSNWTKQ